MERKEETIRQPDESQQDGKPPGEPPTAPGIALLTLLQQQRESKYTLQNEDGTWGSEDLRHLKKLSDGLISGE